VAPRPWTRATASLASCASIAPRWTPASLTFSPRLCDELPDFGEHVTIDGSDLPSYANGQRFVYNHGPERKRFIDPDATWGHCSAISTRKGGGFYGYKVHAAVCTRTGLPVAWETRTARDAEVPVVPTLLDKLADYGIAPTVAVAGRGYDVAPFYGECEGRGIRPVVPLRETPFIKAGKVAPPSCEYGTWTFAGADASAPQMRSSSRWTGRRAALGRSGSRRRSS
jgi:hypothetical protein